MEVQKAMQRHPKQQPVEVDIAARPVRLTYSTGVRRQEPGHMVTKSLWLVEVCAGTTPHKRPGCCRIVPALTLPHHSLFAHYRESYSATPSRTLYGECVGIILASLSPASSNSLRYWW